MTRVSHIDAGLGPSIPASVLAEITERKSSHVNLHQNSIRSLAIPRSNADDGFDHLVALDLSSNSLHDGYALPRFGAAKGVSLLSLTPNLCKLNLSNNGLTEKSFAALTGGCGSRDDARICLPRLHTLDVSHNAFTKLPVDLHVSRPSLRHLDAASNNLKSLSSLVKSLHPYRGKLESVNFQNNIHLCSKELYREKIVFVLGTSLTLLDGEAIGPAEREEARVELERGLTNYTAPRSDEPARRGRAQSVSWSDGEEPHLNAYDANGDDEAMHIEPEQSSQQDDSANEKIRALEEQVAVLSSLVEEQTRNTADAVSGAAPRVDADHCSRAAKETPRSEPAPNDGSMIRCQRLAAASLLMMRLQTKKHEQMNLRLAFSLWASVTRLAGQVKKANAECVELERCWQAKAKELVEKAVCHEAADGKRLLEASEKECQALRDEMERLRKDLERQLEQQREAQELSTEALDRLQSQIQRMEASIRLDREKHAEHIRAKEAEIDCLRESLHRERREKAKLESDANQLSIANQQSKDAAVSQASQLHDLKLEVVQRDTTIQRLKETYSQAARRCSSDRTRCEQALIAEADAKVMLREQTGKMNDVKAELKRARATQNEMQHDLSAKASLVSSLKSDVEEQQRKIASSERRVKSISEERNELQQRLGECSRRTTQLNAQLERAEEDARRAKRHSVDKEQMEAEISRAAELQLSLERLRQRAKRDEAELRARNEATKRENLALREEIEQHNKAAISLHRKIQMAQSESKQIRRAHEVDSQKLDAAERTLQDKEQALTSVEKSLETERALRLDVERRASNLEEEIATQKARMQTAIEGLAKQLAGT
ncbi:hypothetical protein ACHAXT_012808 [Thalassiosira profunda]